MLFKIKQTLNVIGEYVNRIYINIDIYIDNIKRLLYNIDCKEEQKGSQNKRRIPHEQPQHGTQNQRAS